MLSDGLPLRSFWLVHEVYERRHGDYRQDINCGRTVSMEKVNDIPGEGLASTGSKSRTCKLESLSISIAFSYVSDDSV